MGTNAAPMHSLCEQRRSLEIKHYIYENWSQFLDDCELPLDKIKIEPDELLGILNS